MDPAPFQSAASSLPAFARGPGDRAGQGQEPCQQPGSV